MRLAESLDSDNVLQRHIAPLRQVAWRGHHGRSVGFVEVDQTVEVELGPGQWFIRVVGPVCSLFEQLVTGSAFAEARASDHDCNAA
jgi:hypothetical protein